MGAMYSVYNVNVPQTLVHLPAPNDKKAQIRSQNTRLSLKFITFKNINFECLFTLPPPGLELYLIEPSFFEKGRFYLRHWSTENGKCRERL